MGLFEYPKDCEWKIITDGKRTRVYWNGHDVTRDVTSVRFAHVAGERGPEVEIGVLAAHVDLTLRSSESPTTDTPSPSEPGPESTGVPR